MTRSLKLMFNHSIDFERVNEAMRDMRNTFEANGDPINLASPEDAALVLAAICRDYLRQSAGITRGRGT